MLTACGARVAESGSIPILAASRRQGFCIGMRFRKRMPGDGLISERLVRLCQDPDSIESMFASIRFVAEATGGVPTSVLDLDDASEVFCRHCGVNLQGDSLSLPLLFGLHLAATCTPWPSGVYATGAIRHGQRYLCAAVSGARYKLRLLEAIGYRRLFLPRRNYRELTLAGFDVRCITAVPTRVVTCIELWDKFVEDVA